MEPITLFIALILQEVSQKECVIEGHNMPVIFLISFTISFPYIINVMHVLFISFRVTFQSP